MREKKPESTLPDDLATAHQLITTLQEQLHASQREVSQLRHQVDALCRKLFGKKSEKVDETQLALAFEQLSNEKGPANEPVEMDSGESPLREPRRRHPGRRPLPKNLPRRRVVIDVAEDEKVCACGRELTKIGEEVSEKLGYEPASLYVVEQVRPKYACPSCHEGVKVADAPAQAVEKGLATEGLLAHLVVSKYADHLPLHRQEGMFRRHGIELSRATMCGWVSEVADAVRPIYDRIKLDVVSASYIQTDDTPVVVLGEKGSFKGRLWVYLDPGGGQVAFDATATHERAGPESFLQSFRGFLQADAYKGYDALYQGKGIVEVGCWAHGRRRFVEALETDPRAALIVALVRRLYEVEDRGRQLSTEDRKASRQKESAPILQEIDAACRDLSVAALPKSPLGDALRYLQNQRDALGRFIEDGRLVIDNNGAENQLRIVAVGRKNWLFAGSMEGAHRAAILYSLVQSCRLAGVEPFAYFRDILLRVATHPASRVAELTPRNWAKQLPVSVAA